MSRPPKPSRAELLLRQEVDKLKITLAVRNTELEAKAGYAGRLEFLLAQRSKRIDDLTGKLDQVRAQNRQLDNECERLVEMVKLSPPLQVARDQRRDHDQGPDQDRYAGQAD